VFAVLSLNRSTTEGSKRDASKGESASGRLSYSGQQFSIQSNFKGVIGFVKL
jgi:hypothetical protein